MTIAAIFSIEVINVRAGDALDGVSNGFFTLTYEQVEVVRHQAVGIVSAIGAAGIAIIIVLDAHAVEGVDEMVIVLCIAEYFLMINTSHHYMEDTGA